MNRGRPSKVAAFTKVELIVVIGIVALVFALLPSLKPLDPSRRNRIICVSQLKQVGLSFKIFEDLGRFPFHVPSLTNEHTGMLITSNLTAQAWMHFQPLSNELNSPKLLMCPGDASRLKRIAEDFANNERSLGAPGKRDQAVSYFVGVYAQEINPQAVLSGDRNLAPGENRAPYSSWSAGGAVAVDPATAAWTQRIPIHDVQGNIALADGSAQQVNTPRLREQLKFAETSYGTNVNTFLFPQ